MDGLITHALSPGTVEGIRIRWCGWASNPVGGVSRSLVGSTPAAFRHFEFSPACQARGIADHDAERFDHSPPYLPLARRRLRLQDRAGRARRPVEALDTDAAISTIAGRHGNGRRRGRVSHQ